MGESAVFSVILCDNSTWRFVMELISTRDASRIVSFHQAVLDCIPPDGGLYVPAQEEDLRRWIMFMDDSTSFSSIAGTLTSALLKEEFSPVVCERIAGKAFAGRSPEIRQLDDHVFSLELHTGPTGCHKDFGFLWFASALEHLLIMDTSTATVMAAVDEITGRSLAAAVAGKERLRLVLVYPKEHVRGLNPETFVSNGGNIWPVEIDGNLSAAEDLVRAVYSDRSLVEKFNLTLANTMNIGRLLPQVFFYMYAFTRIRKKIMGDLFYAVPAGNYGNLVAGLYGWKFSLPVNGFITNTTSGLSCDARGNCLFMDSLVPLKERGPADPAAPSNLERLEQVFELNPRMLRGLVYPMDVSRNLVPDLMLDVYRKYGIFVDSDTALAWGAITAAGDRIDYDEASVVLVSKDHPAFEAGTIKRACGQPVKVPDFMEDFSRPVPGITTIPADVEQLKKVLVEMGS